MTESRKTAFTILLRCEKDTAYSNIALSAALSVSEMSQADKAFTSELVYGTLERRLSLDFFLSKLSDRKIDEIDRKIVIILHMALYQLLYLDRVPAHSICNEAVEMTKTLASASAAGFVNAVLRNFLRKKAALREEFEKHADLSARYSVSQSIVNLLLMEYGPEKAVSILEGLNQNRKLSLSVNTGKITTERLAETLKGTISDFDTVTLEKQGNIERLPGFSEGWFFVQDRASAKAVTVLNPKPGETVFDVCAAPGGKSIKAAVLMRGTGTVVSRDLHQNKLKLLEASSKRLGLNNIHCEAFDSTREDPENAEKADKVICDAPCSGLGVLSKKPEIRYKNAQDFERLPEIQLKILTQSAKLLKENGCILYSTCTVNQNENGGVVERFLSENPGYSREYEEQILPDIENDGFYIAIIRKKIVY